MMRRPWMILSLILGIGIGGTSTAQAALIPVQTGETIKVHVSGLPRYENGGPYSIDNVTQNKTNVITTFCIERDETLRLDVTNYAVQISDQALLGGSNTDAGDPLDTKTAYLFSNFNHQTAVASGWSTDALQEVIWYIEEESSTLSNDAHTLFNLAAANADGSLYDVRVMNLINGDGTHAQSLLTTVPEPGAIALWSLLGLGGLTVAVRTRRAIRTSAT
jgi:hypothetical protein